MTLTAKLFVIAALVPAALLLGCQGRRVKLPLHDATPTEDGSSDEQERCDAGPDCPEPEPPSCGQDACGECRDDDQCDERDCEDEACDDEQQD